MCACVFDDVDVYAGFGTGSNIESWVYHPRQSLCRAAFVREAHGKMEKWPAANLPGFGGCLFENRAARSPLL